MNVYNLPNVSDPHVMLAGDEFFVVPFARLLQAANVEFSILPHPDLGFTPLPSDFMDIDELLADAGLDPDFFDTDERLEDFQEFKDKVIVSEEMFPSHVTHLAILGPDATHGSLDALAVVMARYHNPVVMMTPVTETATAMYERLVHPSVVAIGWIPGMGGDTTMEIAPALTASEAGIASASMLLERMGIATERVEDRLCLVRLRTLATLINEAAFAVMEGVATPADIDAAMKLGVNYPKGLLQWADEIGVDIILDALTALYDEYGQERYRPCVLFKQYVRAGWTGIRAGRGFYTYHAAP
jgi:hypothetical protein